MPIYCPVFASRIAPVSGSTIPPVLGSSSVPSAWVISPVVGSGVGSDGVVDSVDCVSDSVGSLDSDWVGVEDAVSVSVSSHAIGILGSCRDRCGHGVHSRSIHGFQTHGKSREHVQIGESGAHVERVECGLGELIQLTTLSEQVLVQRFIEQLLDEILLASSAHDIRAIRTGSMAHSRILGGLPAIEVL